MQLSYHALEQAEHRNIPSSDISDAINYGARWPCKNDPSIHYARRGNLVAVLAGGGEWVLTSYRVER